MLNWLNSDIPDPGYALCWDNVQMETKAKHQSRQRQNRMHLWANAFACRHRVDCLHLDGTGFVRASLLPLSVFFPMPDVLQALRSRMCVMVQRILCTHMTCFKEFGDNVTWHIAHQFSDEMRQRSKLVKHYASYQCLS